VLSGMQGISRAFLECWCVFGGYSDVSDAVVFYDSGSYVCATIIKHNGDDAPKENLCLLFIS